jgi:hypothetical protein
MNQVNLRKAQLSYTTLIVWLNFAVTLFIALFFATVAGD